ncbi:MAG TPA: CvpA family protein [Vicinamibacterales bacterium]|nr:CvpA family protein [Vicinamibacterales bacterium]
MIAAGAQAGDDAWYVNAWFEAPPVNANVTLAFDGGGAIELLQDGKVWRYKSQVGGEHPQLESVAQRDALVVLALPATQRITDVAVSTRGGDRIPSSAFLAPVFAQATHFNATDTVIVLVLLVTAWLGYRRGALMEVTDLVVVLVSLFVAVAAFKPLASAVAHVTLAPRAAATLASGIIMLLVATAGYLLAPRMTMLFEPATRELPHLSNRGLGAVVACLRQLPLLAMVLAIGIDAAVLHWASSSVSSSVLGSALLHGWRTIFSMT